MDWTGCDLVEVVEGKVGGRPVVKGTRIPADTVLIDSELGCTAEETHRNFPTLPIETINKLVAFAHKNKQLVP